VRLGGDMGSDSPLATLMSSRRDYIKSRNEVAKGFMRAIFNANTAYAKSPAGNPCYGWRNQQPIPGFLAASFAMIEVC
jgi:hypothetical protein